MGCGGLVAFVLALTGCAKMNVADGDFDSHFISRRVVVSDVKTYTCGSGPVAFGPVAFASADGKTVYSTYLASTNGFGECHDVSVLAEIPVGEPSKTKSHVVCRTGETFCGMTVSSVLCFVSMPWKGNVRVTLDVNYGVCGWRDWNPQTNRVVGEGLFKCRPGKDAPVETLTPDSITRYLNAKGFTGHNVYRERGDRLLCGTKPHWENGAFYGFVTSSQSQPILYRCTDGETFEFLGVVPSVAEYECQVAKLDGTIYALMRGAANENFWASTDGGASFQPICRLPDGKQRPQLQVWRDQLLVSYSAPDEKPSRVRNGRNNVHMLVGAGTDPNKYREVLHVVDPLGIVYYDIVDVHGDLYVLWSNSERFPTHVKWGAVQGKDQLLFAPLTR